MNTYVFDQAWQKERERLTAIESLFDPASRWLLAGLGVVLALWFALVAAWTWGIRESLRGAFGR